MAANAAAAAPAAVQPTPEQRLRAAAAREGDAGAAEVAALLLAGGLDVNAADADGKTALHEAAAAGNLAAATMLLGHGADVAVVAQGFLEWQPLHSAAVRGNAALVSLLLARGADPSAADDDCFTPLYHAIDSGELGAVRAFLDAGVPVGALCTAHEHTLLHMAAMRSGRPHRNVVALLLERGASVHALDNGGNTPLHLWALYSGDPQTFELLLAAGADVDATNGDGDTPLHLLLMSEHEHGPALLLDAGACLEAAGNRGHRPLHCAASRAKAAAVDELLRRGADAHARDDDGATALHRACEQLLCSHAAVVVKALLEAGADASSVDKKGRQPLNWLALAYCGWAGGQAFSERADAAVALLKAAGANLDATDADGNTPLMLAAKQPDDAVLRALARHGARVGPPECGACADLDAQRDGLRSLVVGAAAEAARLRREREVLQGEREAWSEERAALDAARAALEAAQSAASGAAAAETTAAAAKGGKRRRGRGSA